MTLTVGLILLATSVLMFVLGIPRKGEVRAFLRRDGFQALYAIAIVAIGSAGALLIINGLAKLTG